MASDRERCFSAGMDDFLPKPLHVDALRAMLERWASGRRAAVRTRRRVIPDGGGLQPPARQAEEDGRH